MARFVSVNETFSQEKFVARWNDDIFTLREVGNVGEQKKNPCVAVITSLLLYFYTDLCLLCSNVSGFNLSFLNCKILVQTLANFKQFGT